MINIKRGTSNLEIILSFVIFIGFLFFMFLMFPITTTEKSKVGLDAAEQGIINFTKTEMVYFTFVINDTKALLKASGKGCFWLESEVNVKNITVKNENDTLLNATKIGSAIYINGTGKFYQVYSSSEFGMRNFDTKDCKELKTGDFELGVVREYSAVSYNKIKTLNSSYFSGYSDLHVQFNIPKREGFGFILREINGNEIFRAIKERSARAEILARDVPVQIAYQNGSLRYGILHLETW